MRNNYWLNGMMGVIVGDALGLPVQFMYPDEIKGRPQGPVTGMEGYGCFDMPAGSWSDDSSMALAALDSINVKGGIDAADIMENFVKWFNDGEYTPAGITFDVGNTCMKAVTSFAKKHDVTTCGATGEYANGNGALMRIMPVCLYAYDQQKNDGWSDKQVIEQVHQVAALTHNHLRSNMACGLYYFMVREIIDCKSEKSFEQCLQDGLDNGFRFYGADIANLVEMSHYGRLFHLDELKAVPESEIRFSGYVVHSLEAAVWCLIQTDSFADGLLKVVNYGDDSDTVGAIAGGLAGLYYGYEGISREWIEVIKRKDWIEEMVLLNAGKSYDLHRFTEAHVDDFGKALAEIKQGRKQSHWMWYIFPQIDGLGHSDIAIHFAIKSLDEARAYIRDPYLGSHMQEICEALLAVHSNDPEYVMGYPDDLKLKSSMTLFAMADPDNPIYRMVLDKFFEGKMDDETLRRLPCKTEEQD